jgi:hypothetical protein
MDEHNAVKEVSDGGSEEELIIGSSVSDSIIVCTAISIHRTGTTMMIDT